MATADPTAKPAARVASGRDYVLLLFLSAMWGGSFPLIKVAVGSLPPLWVAGGRIGLGALALLAYMTLRGTRLPRGRAVWARLGYMGVVGNIAPFALISWGEQRVPSGIAAILMAMVPLMVVVVAHFRLPDEPLTFGKSVGTALGIIGTLVLIGPSALTGLAGNLAGEVAILLATVCYASSVLAGRGLPPLAPESASGGMLLTAAPIGLLLAAIVDPPWTLAPTSTSLIALAGRGRLRLDEQFPGAALWRDLWPPRSCRAPAGNGICRHGADPARTCRPAAALEALIYLAADSRLRPTWPKTIRR